MNISCCWAVTHRKLKLKVGLFHLIHQQALWALSHSIIVTLQYKQWKRRKDKWWQILLQDSAFVRKKLDMPTEFYLQNNKKDTDWSYGLNTALTDTLLADCTDSVSARFIFLLVQSIQRRKSKKISDQTNPLIRLRLNIIIKHHPQFSGRKWETLQMFVV